MAAKDHQVRFPSFGGYYNFCGGNTFSQDHLAWNTTGAPLCMTEKMIGPLMQIGDSLQLDKARLCGIGQDTRDHVHKCQICTELRCQSQGEPHCVFIVKVKARPASSAP